MKVDVRVSLATRDVEVSGVGKWKLLFKFQVFPTCICMVLGIVLPLLTLVLTTSEKM